MAGKDGAPITYNDFRGSVAKEDWNDLVVILTAMQADIAALEAKGFYLIDESTGGTDTYGQLVGSIDGANTSYTVSNGSYITGTLVVMLNGQTQSQGTTQDWIEIIPASGTFDFNTAPESGDRITASYNTLVLGDFFLLAENEDNLITEVDEPLEVEH
ncbi:MAG: hypothetical protein DRP42_02770 [Tenericutes bacterium]|nr:MAG: hypothetical protein DRP42_02770 [Mycoplasmatota bacterium]